MPHDSADRRQAPANPASIRVLATDYDRTLTDDSLTLVPEALAALERARSLGLRIIVISGRDHDFLEREAAPFADVLVGENGCIVAEPGMRPLDGDASFVNLRGHLDALGIDVEYGRILASVDVEHEDRVRRALAEAGVACDLIRNRDRVMILPPGIDKAVGLVRALKLLGAEPRVTAVAGDGENDLPIFRLGAYNIAVENAVDDLKREATYVSRGYGGHGLAEWLNEVWIPAQDNMAHF